jgi:hypothetical protein
MLGIDRSDPHASQRTEEAIHLVGMRVCCLAIGLAQVATPRQQTVPEWSRGSGYQCARLAVRSARRGTG